MSELQKSIFAAARETVSELLQLGLEKTQAMKPGADPTTNRVGSYALTGRLGRGGMGEVWLAKDLETNTVVALKLLLPALAFDATTTHRFETEARHMAGLSHPHIVKVLRVGTHEGRPFYASPLYRESLAALLARRGALAEAEVARIAHDLADALAYAHSRGIIHRDLKPANILLDDSNHPYLCDFGLVRTVFNDSLVDVQTRTLEGTIAYMSPATAMGQAEDTRCDIYGWGAMVYEMLTGKPPYQAPTSDALLSAVRAGSPRPIVEVNPKASPALARVAEWAMARELRDRYAEMKDILRDVALIRNGQAPLGPHGQQPARSLPAMAIGLILVTAIGFGLWYGFSAKTILRPLQDQPAHRVVPGEPQPQEGIAMKKISMAIATTALVINTSTAQPIRGQKAQAADQGKVVTLVAPYPEPGSPPGKRISLQYAVIEIARQEGLGYRFKESQDQVGEVARRWMQPDIRQLPFSKAMDHLLLPLGLGYEVQDHEVLLKPKRVTLTAPYPAVYDQAPTDRISLKYAVQHLAGQAALGYDLEGSQRNVGEVARRWIKPNFQNIPFATAMNELLTPLGVGYEVRTNRVILVPMK